MTEITTFKPDEATKLFQDLNKPSLATLSYALRHPDTWPDNFEWNYQYCDNCAMGLAHALWKAIPQGSNDMNTGSSRMAKAFAMPFAAAKNVFFGNFDWMPTKTKVKGILWWKKTTRKANHEAVTPEMVADQIDKYLKKVE